jgi:lipoate---protein ligase
MKYFDCTLRTPAENLACDEALLNLCESGLEAEILRFWEPKAPFVVVGYANQAAREVDLAACQKLEIPVFRRCTGGGTVVQGPGCLNYSLILQIDRPYPSVFPPVEKAVANPGLPNSYPLQSITGTNMLVLERQRAALQPLLKNPVQILGHTDLVTGDLKFSGNAQRRLKKCLIFHGTFLLRFDLDLIGKILPMPSKQPGYRRDRPHSDFLTNLEIEPGKVKTALRNVWQAEEPFAHTPIEQIQKLVLNRYSTAAWNLKF